MDAGTIQVACNHCGHKWETRSTRRYTTCPHCLYKVPVKRDEASATPTGKLEEKALENWLWNAACSIRGAVDAPKFKDYILPLIFVKRLSDVHDDEMSRLAGQFGDRNTAHELVQKDHGLVRFYIPGIARWENIRTLTSRVGEQVTDALRAVAGENPKLQGVIDAVDFNATYAGQRVIDDTRLEALVEALSDPRYRLGLGDVEPDILGRAYEYLIRKFAEGQGQSAGEFFTPKEVGWVIARIVNPEQGETVYDPACGSSGLLIKCQLLVQEKYGRVDRPLQLFGQEINHVTYAMSRMNMIVHDMEGEVAIGDTLRNPKFVESGSLRKFDVVVANPMWMQKGYNGGFYENDPFGRFTLGYPPAGTADWGWIQHMFASLGNEGRAAVVLDTGAVSRGSGGDASSKEKEVRQALVGLDAIEGVVLLPDNLFYNTPAQGIILVMSKKKPADRRNQIVLINAAQEFIKGKPKNFIPEEGITRICSAYHAWKEVEGFAKVITTQQASENDYNLIPSRYVGEAPKDSAKSLPDAVAALRAAEGSRALADKQLDTILSELGFTGWKDG